MDLDMIKQNLPAGIYGAIAGAVVLAVVGFNWGGWVTGGTADKMVEAAIVDRLVPICVGQFNKDANKAKKLAALMKTQSWMRGDFVAKQGWATMPGSKEANSDVAESCAEKIET